MVRGEAGHHKEDLRLLPDGDTRGPGERLGAGGDISADFIRSVSSTQIARER